MHSWLTDFHTWFANLAIIRSVRCAIRGLDEALKRGEELYRSEFEFQNRNCRGQFSWVCFEFTHFLLIKLSTTLLSFPCKNITLPFSPLLSLPNDPIEGFYRPVTLSDHALLLVLPKRGYTGASHWGFSTDQLHGRSLACDYCSPKWQSLKPENGSSLTCLALNGPNLFKDDFLPYCLANLSLQGGPSDNSSSLSTRHDSLPKYLLRDWLEVAKHAVSIILDSV